MFKPLLTRILNHIIAQNSWAKPELQPFGGKSVSFRIFLVNATLTVLEDGGLAMAGEAAQADARVTITPSVALRLMAGDETASTQVDIDGDTELASVIAKVLRNMSWDYEEDLSHVIGDISATQLAGLGRKAVSGVKKQTQNVTEMVVEYLQEEHPTLAKKRHIEQFVAEVDALRDDTARIEKRIKKLATQLGKASAPDQAAPTEEK